MDMSNNFQVIGQPRKHSCRYPKQCLNMVHSGTRSSNGTATTKKTEILWASKIQMVVLILNFRYIACGDLA
ncbi:MAG: hypothetical protein CM15mV78_280 [uncultured marine virus]|nr:MAG: hypothetical protein CM15mV78_280 [uncultured marine virus]